MLKMLLLLFASTTTLFGADPKFKDKFDFKKDIVPLLDKYCYRCHDEDIQKNC